MVIEIKFYDNIESQYEPEIWKILCECDNEFVPPLSSRETSYQSKLDNCVTTDVKPISYYQIMIKQLFLIAFDDEKIVGFMTFRSNYASSELSLFSPSNYISTICVTHSYRNKGITNNFYRFIEASLPSEYMMPFISTRTWSTNSNHIHLLQKYDYTLATNLKNHRGPGIDTLYYAKAIN